MKLDENFIIDVNIGDHLLANGCWCIVIKIAILNNIRTALLYVVNGGFYEEVPLVLPLKRIFIYSKLEKSEPDNFIIKKWKPGLIVPISKKDFQRGLNYLDDLVI